MGPVTDVCFPDCSTLWNAADSCCVCKAASVNRNVEEVRPLTYCCCSSSRMDDMMPLTPFPVSGVQDHLKIQASSCKCAEFPTY